MDVPRVVRRALAVSVPVAALVVVAAALAGPPRTITQAQSGKTYTLAKGGTISLRLSGRWAWTEPRASTRAIELTPVSYFVDPGYSEWTVSARARGTATIRATGTPTCVHCGLGVKKVRITIVVG
jgi:hypothetical protein